MLLDGTMLERATYVVGISQEVTDIRQVESDISRLEGVFSVHFNYLTRKLTIVHDGSNDTVQKVNKRLAGITRVPR